MDEKLEHRTWQKAGAKLLAHFGPFLSGYPLPGTRRANRREREVRKDPAIEPGEGGAPYPAGAGTLPPAEGAAGRPRRPVEGVGPGGWGEVGVGVLPAPWSWRPHRRLRRC